MNSPKPRFSFTIREILFAMVAICAIAALFSRYSDSPPTGIPEEVSAQRMLKNAAQKNKLEIDVFASGSGGGGGTDFNYTHEVTALLDSRESAFILMGDIRSQILSMLAEKDCEISSTGQSGKDDSLTSFSLGYRREKTRGGIYVRSFRETDIGFDKSSGKTSFTIWILSYEYCR